MRRLLALIPLLALPFGCDTDWGYALSAVAGQFELIQHTVPIDAAIESGDLSDQQRDKLRLIRDVRAYAQTRVRLYVENYYTSFYDAGDGPVAVNVSASRRDRFEPRLWSFPFVGDLPYLGFFDPEAARRRADELEAQGWDTHSYEIDAYSLGTFIENPVLSPVLRREEYELVELVLHELAHATIGRPGDTPFNESLATFVGRAAARQYYAERLGHEPDRVLAATEGFEDIDRFFAFALDLFAELDAFYRSNGTSEAKLAGRGAIFQAARDRFVADIQPAMHAPDRFDWVPDLPTNNAFMLGIQRYHDRLDVFEAVLQAASGNWPTAIGVYRAAAAHDGDPHAYLRDWADQNGPGGPGRVKPAPETRRTVEPTPCHCPPVCLSALAQRRPCVER